MSDMELSGLMESSSDFLFPVVSRINISWILVGCNFAKGPRSADFRIENGPKFVENGPIIIKNGH